MGLLLQELGQFSRLLIHQVDRNMVLISGLSAQLMRKAIVLILHVNVELDCMEAAVVTSRALKDVSGWMTWIFWICSSAPPMIP